MYNKFVIATGNKNKVKEFNRILEPLGLIGVTAKEMGIDMDLVEENGSTFAENSLLKARYAYEICHLPVIADDSGLCVDALNGAPGIYSARYAGPNATDQDKCIKLLNDMKDIKEGNRTACFHCCITCILSEDDIISVEGLCPGKIGFDLVGTEGFGYDPVFIPDDPGTKTMATLGGAHKDKVGHRGKGMRMLEKELKSRI